MGVPYLLSYLRRTYPSVFDKGIARPKIQHIYLDANAMLYQIAEETKDPVEIARRLVSVAESYASAYGGSAHIYIDGAAHMAKLREQRIRRFMYEPVSVTTITDAEPGERLGQYDARVDTPWTSAMFSPGTNVMHSIHEEISRLMPTSNVATYSSYLEPAEGEHKIVDAIKMLPSGTSVAIVGKDADLLLIGMILVEKGWDTWILRHDDTASTGSRDGYKPDDPIWNVSCADLRDSILDSINKDTIWDFIVATFLVGNDFLPPVPEMANLRDVMPNIMQALVQLPSSLVNEDGIEWATFKRYITILYDMVPSNVEWIGLPDSTKMGKEAFSSLYYRTMSPFPVNDSLIVDSYTRTMDWVYQYYQYGPTRAHVAWQYPIHYSPSLHSLMIHLKDDIDIEWPEQVQPLEPHQALACILPPWLRNLLPVDVRERMGRYDLYYPYTFDMMPVTESPIVPVIPYHVASTI